MNSRTLFNSTNPSKKLCELLLNTGVRADGRAVDIDVLGGKKTEGVGGGDRHELSVLSYTYFSRVR